MSSKRGNSNNVGGGAAIQILAEPLICPFTLDIYSNSRSNTNSSNSTNSSPTTTSTPSNSTVLSQNHTHSPIQNGPTSSTTPTAALPRIILDTLPTVMHSRAANNSTTLLQVHAEIPEFLARDLDVQRLNDIHSRMWMCGRPLNARGLHRQLMMNRQIVHTEQADLHLLHYDKTMFIKPLPAYLLCPKTWELHFSHDRALHENATGFLLSYIWLLRTPLDFTLAKKEGIHLLPPSLTWPHWKTLTTQFLSTIDPNSLDQVNKRYHFGELRLGRINTIYRLNPRSFTTHFVRGYLYGYNRYVVFFQRNLGWVLVVFVWFSLILSAMQVGTTVKGLEGNDGFGRASYGFVIFSIVAVAALLAFVGGMFFVVFVFNMFAAIGHARREEGRRRKLGEKRLEGRSA
ncbi:hypothetical protein EJ08DRAFT_641645 [Tothia fuscella]|uniref:Uncharacterized protein n=1 Tax=Tothia fuscella TaxID=1048955 RepID=A0A9P4TSV3_9PEZI|nr:hypothetical protein EJ08DRAFT_641645 [Tothia fuscella]